MRRFSGDLEVFSGKMIEMLNLPAALQQCPVAVKQWLQQQALVNMARRKLVERSKSGAVWGRFCWDRLRVGGMWAVPPLPTPAPPAGSWVW